MTLKGWRFVVVCALLVWVPTLICQTASTGALTGTITDSSGSVVPNATVSATSLDTGQARTATTGADGTYKFGLLPPGNYRVKIEAGGFKLVEIPSATVTVTETAVLDHALEVGTQTQTVTVEGDVETVQTASSTVGAVVNTQTMVALPLSTRNYTNLLAMSAGADAAVVNSASLGKSSTLIAVSGADPTQNTYLQDGVSVNNWLSPNSTQEGSRYGSFAIPNPDTIQEFKIQTSTYDAGYGRNPGANVNIVTKSGTNDFHGDAFGFFRNTALNANDYFWNATPGHQGMKQVLNQNEYGGVLGGPIKKDKLFFFVAFQEADQKNGVAAGGYSSVILPPIPSGDRGTCPTGWTALSQCSAAAQAFVPALGAAVCPANHPGNAFDSIKTSGSMTVSCTGSNINPVAVNILQLQLPGGGYLIPGSGSTTGQYLPATFSDPAQYTNHQGMGNLDYVINGKNTLSSRYYYETDPTISSFESGGAVQVASSILPGFPGQAQKTNQTALLKLTTILSNNVVNEARISYQRIVNTASELGAFTNSQVGMTDITPSINNLSDITITGLFAVGAQKYYDQSGKVNQFEWADQLSWSHGKHTIRTGFEAQRVRADLSTTSLGIGTPTFQSFPDFLIGLAGCQGFTGVGTCSAANPGNTNGGTASNVQSPGGPYANAPYDDLFRLTVLSSFIQDDFKVAPRLTVNVGVRWEWDGFPIEANGNTSGFWPNLAALAPNPGTGCLTPTGQIGTVGGTGCSLVGFVVPKNYQGTVPAGIFQNNTNYVTQSNPPWDDFAPRVGFAWQPLASSRLAIRGGAGYFYELINGSATGLSMINSPAVASIAASPLASLQTPFIVPGAIPGPSGTFGFTPRWANLTTFQNSNLSPTSLPPNLTVPVAYEWNLNAQYEFLRNWVLELGYVGSHGIHMESPGTGGAGGTGASVPFNLANLASVANPINGQTTNTTTNAPDRVPYLGITTTASESANNYSYKYNALQATVRRQLSHGLQLQASYSWNRAFVTNPVGINTYPYFAMQYAPNTTYHPQRLVVNYVWNLPLGHPAGVVGKVVDGWSLSGVTTIQDGTPLDLIDSRDGSAFYGSSTSGVLAPATLCPGASISQAVTTGSTESRLNNYFTNAGSVFCAPAAVGGGTATGFGNVGMGSVHGPGQNNWDMSIAKLTKVGGLREDATLLFRAEFFNAFNHPIFGLQQTVNGSIPGSLQVNNASFGVINFSAVNPRLIQLVLKYSF